MHERDCWEASAFLTLTFSDEHLPPDLSLDRSVMPRFMRRLRYHLAPGIRYYGAGEYGDGKGRRAVNPHYHVCLFNVPPRLFADGSEVDPHRDQEHPLFTHPAIDEAWEGQGFARFGELTRESAAYVARYCTKKITGKMALAHYGGREPEFAQMSRRPGIGRDWFEKNKRDVYPSDFLVANGHKQQVPRYYTTLLEEHEQEALKAERKKRQRLPDGPALRARAQRTKRRQSQFRKGKL